MAKFFSWPPQVVCDLRTGRVDDPAALPFWEAEFKQCAELYGFKFE